MAKRPRIGDILEVPTSAGLGYIHYAFKNNDMGPSVRVLPGLFADRPPKFDEIANKRELYYVHLPLGAMVSLGCVTIVGHAAIPHGAERPSRIARPLLGSNGQWVKYRVYKVKAPSTNPQPTGPAEERGVWLDVIWNDTMLEEKMAQGWTPDALLEENKA